MPPKKTGEPKEVEGQCILKLGRSNNIRQWTEEMKTSISLLYRVAGNFLTMNVRHEYPIPREEDYLPVLPAPEEGQPAIPPLPAALVTKLREFAFERRNKQIAQLIENGQKIFPMMWERCSPVSQRKFARIRVTKKIRISRTRAWPRTQSDYGGSYNEPI
jgi:hypothetical protein